MEAPISIKTVAALIDATSTIEKKIVGIRYITAEGHPREMKISKRASVKKKPGSHSKKRNSPNMKDNGLIQIIDHTQGEEIPKTLFLYGIIGFNPDGDLDNLFDVL